MNREATEAFNKLAPWESAGVNPSKGIARDKLIFIIICSAAISVAIVTLVAYLHSRGTAKQEKKVWQCLECEYEFTKVTKEISPIDCPKGHPGQAVLLGYHKCTDCGKRIPMSHVRLTEGGRAQYEAMQAHANQTDTPLPEQGAPEMNLPQEIQFRYKQADGSYAWTEWMSADFRDLRQVFATLTCPECGAKLFDTKGDD